MVLYLYLLWIDNIRNFNKKNKTKQKTRIKLSGIRDQNNAVDINKKVKISYISNSYRDILNRPK